MWAPRCSCFLGAGVIHGQFHIYNSSIPHVHENGVIHGSLINILVNMKISWITNLTPQSGIIRDIKRNIDKYLDDYVENDIIVGDILDIICARQEQACQKYLKLEDLELKLRE